MNHTRLAFGLLALLGPPIHLSAAQNHWTASGPGTVPISALAVDPAYPAFVYAAAGNIVFRSSDFGETWQSEGAGLEDRILTSLSISPERSDTLWAGTLSGVLESSDRGVDWDPLQSTFPIPAVYAVAVSSEGLYAGTEPLCYGHFPELTCRGGIFRRSSASSWSWLASFGLCGVESLIANSERILAGLDCGIAVSRDAGQTFPVADGTESFPAYSLSALTADPSLVWAAGPAGILRSLNGAATFSPFPTPGSNVSAILANPADPGLVLAATGEDVFVSPADAADWRRLAPGLAGEHVLHLTADPSGTRYYAGTESGKVYILEIVPGLIPSSRPAPIPVSGRRR
jgi:ligand-binding sensor domain-containing protein